MKLSIKPFLIIEMKDWKNHFINGTKGMKKTNIDVLNYVEGLLLHIYDNQKDKVNENKLAPWLVGIVDRIGIDNIGTEQLNRITTILNWYKETNTEANIPKLSIDQAYDFVQKSIEKAKAKKEQEKSTTTSVNIPPLKDEIDGKIQRVAVLNDGRMWVKVIDPGWFEETCGAGRTKGVKCQSTTSGKFATGNYESYSLIGPPKDKPSGFISTIGSISINRKDKSIEEMKQENNQHPGAQATSGGWKDVDEQFINFIAFHPIMKEKINYFSDGGYGENGQYGAQGSLKYIMDHRADLFNKLAKARPDIIENNRSLIIRNPKFGEKWFLLHDMDVVEKAITDPIDFLKRIRTYQDLFGAKIKEALSKVDIAGIAKTNPPVVEGIIDVLIDNVSPDKLKDVLNNIDFPSYIKEKKENFMLLLKKMSNIPEYKDFYKNLIFENSKLIIESFGGRGVGLSKFLQFAESPKLEKHKDSVRDKITGEYWAEREVRDENGRTKTEKFVIPDNLKVFSQKERKDFISKNQDYIKSFFTGDEKSKEIEYLRFLFSESNSQDIERTLKKEKDEFVKYYDDKFSKKQSNYPGIIEFYMVLNKNKPSYVQTKGDKTYFPMDLEDAKNEENIKKIISYYYNKSKEETIIGKRYSAIDGYLTTLEASGEPNVADLLIKTYNPKKVSPGGKPEQINYALFFNLLNVFSDKNKVIETIKSMQEEIESIGYNGRTIYNSLLEKYSEKGYDVHLDDMIEYKGQEGYGIFLQKGRKYRVFEIGDTEIKNGKVNVNDDTKSAHWYKTSDFKVPIRNLSESELIRNYIKNKLFEQYGSI